jgi:hypothetical protein
MPTHSPTVLAGALITLFAAHAVAQTPDLSATSNIRQSQQYEQMLQNPAFRASRMQRECGPVTDPELHANCVASFGGTKSAGSG